jgi:hypothetical protein
MVLLSSTFSIDWIFIALKHWYTSIHSWLFGGTLGETLTCLFLVFALDFLWIYSRVCLVFGLSPSLFKVFAWIFLVLALPPVSSDNITLCWRLMTLSLVDNSSLVNNHVTLTTFPNLIARPTSPSYLPAMYWSRPTWPYSIPRHQQTYIMRRLGNRRLGTVVLVYFL